MLEVDFVRGLLGSPNLAMDAVTFVEPVHFEDKAARAIFAAISDCLVDGEVPTPPRVSRRVLSRIPDFAEDIEQAAQVMSRSALMELSAQVSARGTKRQMAKAARQVAEHITRVIDNDAITPSELQATLAAAVAQSMARAQRQIRSLDELGEEVVEAAAARFEGRAEALVWDIGIGRVDRRLQAGPGKVTVLGADSGHGKTSFVGWYLAQSLRQSIGLGCVYLPLADMSPHDIAGRRLAAASRINSNSIIHRAPDSPERMQTLRDALGRLRASYGRRFLVAKPGKTLAEIASDIRRGCLMLRHRGVRPGHAVVDYAQVVKSTERLNRFERLERLAEMAEELSDELGIHILITSQLNSEPGKAKPGEGRAPRTSDIWGGKEMEWYSDSMLILLRKSRKKAQPLRDPNGIEIPTSSPSYAPIPDHLTAVYDVELWGLKGRSGTNEHPAHLDYLAPIGVYQEPGTGDLKRWNAQSAPTSAQHSLGLGAGQQRPPSKWGQP